MPTPPQRGPYPQNAEEAKGTPHARAHALFGTNDVAGMFNAPKTTAPWPMAGKKKSNPRGYDPDRVGAALKAPEQHMTDLDPRDLHASQPWVTRAGVDHYMTDEYKQTGQTFADQDQPGNRNPIVWRDTQGRNKLLSGHHRATAALLRGEQFRALLIEE